MSHASVVLRYGIKANLVRKWIPVSRGCRRSGRVRLSSYFRISGCLPESCKESSADAYGTSGVSGKYSVEGIISNASRKV